MAGISLTQASILVVDDEAFSRTMVSQTLKRMGAREILHAGNGQEAVDMLAGEAKNIHAAIIDFRMPVMHGLHLLKLIRMNKTAAKADLPCAMFTGHAEKQLVGLALALDVDLVLAKPVTLKTLESYIPKLLEAKEPVKDPSEYETLDVDRPMAHLLEFDDNKASADKINAKTLKYLKPVDGGDGVAGAGDAPEGYEGPEKLVAIGNLAKGMILTRHVLGNDNVLLLSAGLPLSERYIDRLRDMGQLHEPVTHVWVRDA